MRRQRHSREQVELTRRALMLKSACATMGTAALASAVWDLRYIKAATAASLRSRTASSSSVAAAATDYKALVCLFLFGGNDANNFLIATDPTAFSAYTTARGGTWTTTNTSSIAIAAAGTTATDKNGVSQNIGVLPITSLSNDGHTYGLHPACTEMQSMFNAGNMAFVANVGTLVFPTTKSNLGSVKKPSQLFSHDDQQIQWQTSLSDTASRTGWGGRCADLLNSSMNSGTATISMSVSLGGTNTWEVGNQVNELKVSTSGGLQPTSGVTGELNVLRQLIGDSKAANVLSTLHPNLQEQDFAQTFDNGINSGAAVTAAVNALPSATATAINNSFSSTAYSFNGGNVTGLGQQLRMIARLIAARTTIGLQRQIFFATIGGFDLHSGQGAALTPNTANQLIFGPHYNLLRDLSVSLNCFYAALGQLGSDATGTPITKRVTTFSVSDFSRTFKMNTGFGSDHGWGNHQFIVGGAVQTGLAANTSGYVPGTTAGSKVYGTFPNYVVGGSDDYDSGSGATGRWIPSTSCDEYFATLAKWFGVDPSMMSTILPNIGRFAHPDLGFVA